MAKLKSVQVAADLPLLTASSANDLIPLFGDYVMTGDEAEDDILELVGLSAGYVPVDVIVDSEDLGATAVVKVGVMSGDFNSDEARTCGGEFIAAGNIAAAALLRMSVPGGGRVAPTQNDRGIGLEFTTLTVPVEGAKIRVTVLARPQIDGA